MAYVQLVFMSKNLAIISRVSLFNTRAIWDRIMFIYILLRQIVGVITSWQRRPVCTHNLCPHSPSVKPSLLWWAYVCLSVCLFVCLLAYLKNYTSNIHLIFCTHITYGSGSLSSCHVSTLIRYVLPVLWMTSCFHFMEWMGQNQTRPICFIEFARWQHRVEGYVCSIAGLFAI